MPTFWPKTALIIGILLTLLGGPGLVYYAFQCTRYSTEQEITLVIGIFLTAVGLTIDVLAASDIISPNVAQNKY